MENFDPGPEDILRHKMENFSQDPDPEVWDLINKQLPSTAWSKWGYVTPYALLLLITGTMFGSYLGAKYFSSSTENGTGAEQLVQIQSHLKAMETKIDAQNKAYDEALRTIMTLQMQNKDLIYKQSKLIKQQVSNAKATASVKVSEPFETNAIVKLYDFDTENGKDIENSAVSSNDTIQSANLDQIMASNGNSLGIKKLLGDSIIQESASKVIAFDSTRSMERPKTIPVKQRKFWLGAFLAPEYAYRNVNGMKDIVDDKNQNERAKLDLSAGLDVLYQATPKISIQSGLHFLNMGERYVVNEVYKKTIFDTTQNMVINKLANPRSTAEFDNLPNGPQTTSVVNNSYTSSNSFTNAPSAEAMNSDKSTANNNYSYGSTTTIATTNYGLLADTVITTNFRANTIQKPIKADLKSSYTLFSIPLLINYTFYEKQKISLFASAGGSFNVLLGGQNVERSATGDVNLTKIINSGVVSGSLLGRVGIAFKATDNIKFTIVPTFRYFINSAINENKNVQIQPYSLSLQFGILKRF